MTELSEHMNTVRQRLLCMYAQKPETTAENPQEQRKEGVFRNACPRASLHTPHSED
jgi:hypothetical protein